MVNQESFLRQRITKAVEQVKKQRRENNKKEIEQVMYQCLVGDQGLQKLSLIELNQLRWMVDKNIKEIEDKMNFSTTNAPKSSLTISNVDSQAELLGWTNTPKDQAYDDHEMAKNNMTMQQLGFGTLLLWLSFQPSSFKVDPWLPLQASPPHVWQPRISLGKSFNSPLLGQVFC
ncbi:agamous-like MADS-box protein AGL80 [Quillaja saponaria]|uniref:Agamous-like MADS-box protein AGL80 n=1 Tax=Quillaja saponaria TaxID=32244 RepID=A0AAD7L3G7_QUISA|nr:agamous-like MADS-box protein AGL80 [Quillaja saponaria]